MGGSPRAAPAGRGALVLIGTSRVSAATSLSISARGNQMARPEKVAVVDEIRTKLAEADATVLTEYRGLTVHELADLRGSLRRSGTEYKVFKNTLARRAIEGAGYDEITDRSSRARSRSRSCTVTPRRRRRRCATSARQPGPWSSRAVCSASGSSRPSRSRRWPTCRRARCMLTQIAGLFQAAADPGGRSVPGLHPQPRLRRAGADRRARRRRRGCSRRREPAGARRRRAGGRRRTEPSRRAGRRRTCGRGRCRARRGRGRGEPANPNPPSPSNTREKRNPWQP